MPVQPLLILTAMQMEADAIDAANAVTPYALRTIGPGAVRMLEDFDRDRPRGIILAGIGGGLDPSLRCGDVVIDELSDLKTSVLPYRRGGIYTADRIIATPQQKREAMTKTGAIVVDMENAIVRDRAKQLGVPFLGVRVIGDGAADTLNPIVLTLIDENGRAKIGAVASALVCHPLLLRDLMHLRRTAKIALQSLTGAMGQILTAENP
jgi:adenosylhomocysteine nucleosidase